MINLRIGQDSVLELAKEEHCLITAAYYSITD
jgi:hypothetical protein